ncbi:uncharacterized protein BDW43DRAFT_34332 [Aspergillus alliaceus]|uniref:uncharacterized protein n=1 Tax=Petromyces alliaceus TaxID=209559 RepID=UPI0012A5A475|nr:uncharacterized protein BDW43DRAFT_34332 [Aspergillus alliaceus]KAB8235497.1 hypothetical protein BDW43DRAFT_34332 [Aspergillus alliaceus]
MPSFKLLDLLDTNPERPLLLILFILPAPSTRLSNALNVRQLWPVTPKLCYSFRTFLFLIPLSFVFQIRLPGCGASI